MNRWLITFLASLIFSGIVYSVPLEMKIFPAKASACQFSIAAYEIEVSNPGATTQTFEFSSSNEKFIIVAPEKLTLGAKEKGKVFLWFNPTDELSPGVHTFSLFARQTTTGEISEVSGRIEVLGCHKVSLKFKESSQTTCPKEIVEYEITILNEGLSSEEFELSSTLGNLSSKKIFLSPNESKKIILAVEGKEIGVKEISVTAKSTTSYAKDTESAILKTIKCYDSTLAINPKTQEICVGTFGEYNLEIVNTGLKSDNFVLESSIGELSETSFSLKQGESKKIRLKFKPDTVKNYEILVKAKSKSPTETKAIAIGAGCRIPRLILEPSSQKICENEFTIFNLTLKNVGSIEDTFILKSNIGELEKNKIELKPNKSEKIALKINAPGLKEGSHEIVAEAISTTNSTDRAKANLTIENCYDLSFDFSVKKALENRALLYTFDLKNTGSRKNTYEIEVIDGVISLKPEENITLNPGQSGKSFLFQAKSFNETMLRKVTLIIQDASGTVKIKKEIAFTDKIIPKKAFDLGAFFSRIPLDLVVAIVLGIVILLAMLLRKRE